MDKKTIFTARLSRFIGASLESQSTPAFVKTSARQAEKGGGGGGKNQFENRQCLMFLILYQYSERKTIRKKENHI